MNVDEQKYYAFFDVDGTLMKGKPMLDFLKYFYIDRHSNYPIIGLSKYLFFKIKVYFMSLMNFSREAQNEKYYKCFKNQFKGYVANLGNEWFKNNVSDDSYFQCIINELNLHKSKGAEIVLVSGSFSACLNKIAEKLSVNYILGSQLEEVNGKYTGKLSTESMIGRGKKNAITRFLLNKSSVDLRKCFAYGDHISDEPMLSMVGNPVVIAGDIELEKIAMNKKWRVIFPS